MAVPRMGVNLLEQPPPLPASDRVWQLFAETTSLPDLGPEATVRLPDYRLITKRYDLKVKALRPEDVDDSSEDEAYENARHPFRESQIAAKEMRGELRAFEARLKAAEDASDAPPPAADGDVLFHDADERDRVILRKAEEAMAEDDLFEEADPAASLENWTPEEDLEKALAAAGRRRAGESVRTAVARVLRVLDLEAKEVNAMDEGLYEFSRLKVLNLNHNAFEDLDLTVLQPSVVRLTAFSCDASRLLLPPVPSDTPPLPNLQSLWIGCNHLTGLPTNLAATCPNLTSLDASYNHICAFDNVIPALRPLRKLKHLSLCGNPLALRTDYANVFRGALPQLVYLDDRTIPPPAAPTKKRENDIRTKFGLPLEIEEVVEQALGRAEQSDTAGSFGVRVRLQKASGLPFVATAEEEAPAAAKGKGKAKGKKGKKGAEPEAEEPKAGKPRVKVCIRLRLPEGDEVDVEAIGPDWAGDVQFEGPKEAPPPANDCDEGAVAPPVLEIPSEQDLNLLLPTSVGARDQLLMQGFTLDVYFAKPVPPAKPAEGSDEAPVEDGDARTTAPFEYLYAGSGRIHASSLLTAQVSGGPAASKPETGNVEGAVQENISVHERCSLAMDTAFLRWLAEEKVKAAAAEGSRPSSKGSKKSKKGGSRPGPAEEESEVDPAVALENKIQAELSRMTEAMDLLPPSLSVTLLLNPTAMGLDGGLELQTPSQGL